MSPVTAAGSVTGTNFVVCSYGKKVSARSSGMKFKKQNQNGETYTCIVRGCRGFVDSCNFTNKANSQTPKVKIHV